MRDYQGTSAVTISFPQPVSGGGGEQTLQTRQRSIGKLRERLPQCGRTSKSTDIQLQKASSATAQLFFDVTAKNAVASW